MLIPVLAELQDMLNINCHTANFRDILKKVNRLKHADRRKLIGICKHFFDSIHCRKHQPTRVAVSKVCIALLPDSLSLIEKWLKCKSKRGACEVHFSLFVFCYEIQNFECLKECKFRFLKLIKSYLMDSKADTSQAVWMAGESLGDDWCVAESLPILMRILKEAPHVVAREAALHGLSHALKRVSRQDATLISNSIQKIISCRN